MSVGLGVATPGVPLSSVSAYLAAVFQDQQFRLGITNSLLIATLVTLVCGALAIPLALLGRRYEFAGKGLLSSMLMVPLVLPPF
ncbi:hypothetical protein ACTGVF_11390, partial [Streptococcus suis]